MPGLLLSTENDGGRAGLTGGGLGRKPGCGAVGEGRSRAGMRLGLANELPEDRTDGDEVDCAADELDGPASPSAPGNDGD
jgi:hypothetical protein